MARKKSNPRKTVNSFNNTVLNVFAQNPTKQYNFRQLAHTLGITDGASKQLVKDILVKLAAAKEIVELKRGKFQIHPDKTMQVPGRNTITGIVDMKQTGKAYVMSDELPEDVFIAANNTFRALNGDTVKVHLFPARSGRKLEGRITEVIKRGKSRFSGIVEISKNYAFVIPDDTSVPVDLFIPLTKLNGAKSGEKVIAQITDWPRNSKNPFGEITDVLGLPGDNNVEMQSILANAGFPLQFSKQVMREAEKIPGISYATELKVRKDFREIFTCTIDPEDAKDFDDALSLQKTKDGKWEVGIHIADVSHYVKPGSSIDAEAYERATSIYLVDRGNPNASGKAIESGLFIKAPGR